MNKQELEAAVTKYAAAKQAHDLDATIDMCAEDCTYQSIGFGPVVRGRDELRQFFGSLFDSVDYSGDFEGTAYSADSAIVWGRWGGTITGDFLGLGTVEGNTLDIPVVFHCTFRDGLLVKEVGYFDTALFCEQAGIKVSTVRPGLGSAFAKLYEQFWQAPDRSVTKSVITEDIKANWPGPLGIGEGVAHYLKQIDRILTVMPDIKLEVIDFLAEGELAFLEFRAYGTVNGQPVEFFGIDRFKVAEDGRVYDSKVCFDPAVLQNAVWLSDSTSLEPTTV
ncbi:nuclear transport factor 2 family protein [Nocardia nova]|uniref:nuclear transport factor 2 family protein n=1 Tax=Nocardia nova TaxID=37330 RepID=UPI0033D9D1E1